MSQRSNPTSITGQQVLKDTRYLIVIVSENGLIKMLECPGLSWFVDGLQVGHSLPEVLQAIVGACDHSTSSQLFPYVQLSADIITNVHVLKGETGAQIILHDVSDAHDGAHKFQQKAHDAALLLEQQAELNRVLARKHMEAEQANEAKSRFIATMSDEFRSPISSIMAHAEALHAERPEAREPAAIQRASWYLLTLLENLLEQSRTGGQERSLDLSGVEIPALLKDMRKLFGTQAAAKGLRLEVHRSDDAGMVLADELRLRQVLVNLLSNALRHTELGTISLVCRRQGDAIEFRVSDTGKGVEDSDLERIFEPFERIDPGTEPGAGLGLTVSRQLVAAMQGKLVALSTVGEGSTFSFSLKASVTDELKTFESLDGLTALVVENDVDLRKMYCVWLEQWGVEVRAVANCAQAETESASDPADLVLTDLFLEDGNGIELLTRLRISQPGLATVLCSSSDSIEMFLDGDETVVDAFVPKPVSARRLESALKKAIGHSQSA